MICTLIMVSSLYVNPCKIDVVSPWADMNGNQCVIRLDNGYIIKTLAKCDEIVTAVNKALEDQKGFWW